MITDTEYHYTLRDEDAKAKQLRRLKAHDNTKHQSCSGRLIQAKKQHDKSNDNQYLLFDHRVLIIRALSTCIRCLFNATGSYAKGYKSL